ncbi:MAG: ADP-ribosylglycohydrolase family protein [Pseudomonadota bacterium]
MKYTRTAYQILLFFTNFEGRASAQDVEGNIVLPGAQRTPLEKSIDLDPETYFDRVLGALVGSVIGDSMGASTEMMDRADIRVDYGYITCLTHVAMPRQAERP